MHASPHQSPSRVRVIAGLAQRVEIAAMYGAMALIAAVVFGTLSVHPF